MSLTTEKILTIFENNNLTTQSTQLPSTWAWATFGDVCKVQGGYAFKSQEYQETGVLLVRISNLVEGHVLAGSSSVFLPEEYLDQFSGYCLQKGDVLIAMSGATTGKMATYNLNSPALLNQRVGRFTITAPALLDSGYLIKLVSSISERTLQQAYGAAQPNISPSEIEQFQIPLPPLNEQRRIVTNIEALKARSQRVKEELEAIPALLDQFRQSVLAAAFRGDLTADWREKNPDVEPAEKLVERVASKFKQGKSTGRAATVNVISGRAALSVGESETNLPKGWIRVSLLTIARLESGHTPSRKHSEYWGGDIPWVGITDAREHHGQRIFNTKQYTNDLGLKNSAARLLPTNTVCLSRTASVGYVCIMGIPMATSQDFVNWVCSEALVPEFLLYALLAEDEHLLKFGKGTTHTTIYFPEVKAFHITLPPLEEQHQIIKLVQERLSKINKLKQQLESLSQELSVIDQSILAKAFRGELVPQDPNDEPASILLERIRAEREKLDTKKKAKGKTEKKSRKAKPEPAEPEQLSLPGFE
jgi:type I restriction enzyme S subunit